MEELFAEAALGMVALTGAQTQPGATVRRRIELAAEDYESLLVAWLQELLYYTEAEERVFTTYHIEQLDSTHLRAEVEGAPTGRPDKAIKAATYHNLKINQTPEGYETTIVFDV